MFFFVAASRNPGPKRQKVEDDLQDNQEDAQSLPEEDRIPCQPRFQREKKKYVYQMPQFGKNYINVTDTEGRRVFLPVLEPSDMVSRIFIFRKSFLSSFAVM